MKKSIKFLSIMLLGCMSLFSSANAAEQTPDAKTVAPLKSATKSNVVIFKVHDVNPVFEDGVVTGCDFTITLYNRTAINFRSFTLNMQWRDVVDERFRFDRYIEAYMGAKELEKEKKFIGEDAPSKPVQTAITVNAFGVDKQISVRSHVNSEKCYLMLDEAAYNVSPCDIARNIDTATGQKIENKACTELFQLVDTSNPEYFGQFKKLTLAEIAAQNKEAEMGDLADIDNVIDKIVENLGASDTTLTNIN